MRELHSYVEYGQNNLLSQKDIMSGLKAFCTFDSYMIPTEDLLLGEKRLLEVTRRLQFPVHANIRALITSDDVIHS